MNNIKVGAELLATWLTYLRIAQNIKNRIEGFELSHLMLGFIAPFLDKDQVETLEFEDVFNYSKDLMNCRNVILDEDILSFKNRFVEPPFIIYKSDNKRSFLWGYYFNMIVSKLWLERFSKVSDLESFVRASDIYDFVFLSKNGYELIELFDKSEITMNKCEDFNIFDIMQLKDKIVKYYSNNRSIINSDSIKNFNPKDIEEFIKSAESLCVSHIYGKA